MPLPLAASLGLKFGLPLLTGLFGGGKQQSQESTSNQQFDVSNVFSQEGASSTIPQFLPQAVPLSQGILQSAFDNLNTPPQFDQGALSRLQLQQTGGVNQAFAGAGRNLAASLAARGLSNSPGAISTGFANLEGARAGTLGNIFANIEQQRFNLPILQQQLQSEKLRNALAALRPFMGQSGTTSAGGSTERSGTTTTKTTGSASQPGSPAGGFRNVAEALSFNQGSQLPSGTSLGDLVEPGLPDISGLPAPVFQ